MNYNFKNIKSWKEFFNLYFNKNKELKKFINSEYSNKNKIIYPDKKEIFRSFELCPLDKIKVIIIGQDPYFNGNADGLAFSSKFFDIKTKSLEIIFSEIYRTEKIKNNNYKLDNWAKQGILLLNRVLTVEEGYPLSHYNKGWENFTNIVIESISRLEFFKVFMLWGNKSKILKPLIFSSKYNLILEACHPAARGSYNNFIGCNVFKDCNLFLEKNCIEKINWSTGKIIK